LQSGVPVHEQVVFAAKKAIISGRLRPGEAFPSVRTLSAAVKIHFNTAQKVIAQLQQEGLLEVRPGIGTVVAQRAAAGRMERARLLARDVEALTVEAIKLGVGLEELQDLVNA
jgi:GntR family transcriptional regulator